MCLQQPLLQPAERQHPGQHRQPDWIGTNVRATDGTDTCRPQRAALRHVFAATSNPTSLAAPSRPVWAISVGCRSCACAASERSVLPGAALMRPMRVFAGSNLQNNQLSGSIPDSLGNLTRLSYMCVLPRERRNGRVLQPWSAEASRACSQLPHHQPTKRQHPVQLWQLGSIVRLVRAPRAPERTCVLQARCSAEAAPTCGALAWVWRT